MDETSTTSITAANSISVLKKRKTSDGRKEDDDVADASGDSGDDSDDSDDDNDASDEAMDLDEKVF